MYRGGSATYWTGDGARTSPRTSPDNGRRHGRLRCEEVACGLGEVLDVSASGLRVFGRGTPPNVGGTLPTTLTSLWGELPIAVRVIRVEPGERDQWQAGCEFEEVNPALRTMLTEIARSAATNETILGRPVR